jgi:hypothetical protein
MNRRMFFISPVCPGGLDNNCAQSHSLLNSYKLAFAALMSRGPESSKDHIGSLPSSIKRQEAVQALEASLVRS